MTAGHAGRRLAALLALLAVVAGAGGPVTAASQHPEFADNIVAADRGDVVEIPVTFPDAANPSARIAIGSQEVNFRVTATVTDADGDGTVVVKLDTSAAGNGDPSSYLSVSDGDGLSDARQVTGAVDPPLDGGDYPMSLGPTEDPVDVGTLVVEAPSDGTTDRTTTDSETTTDETGTTIVHEGERLTLRAGPGQVVTGETTLDPGTPVSVRLRSSASGNPFLRQFETEVTEYGTFEVTVDLSNIEPGTEFLASVHHNRTTLTEVEGAVVACEDRCEASPTTTAFESDELAVASVVEVTQGRRAHIPVALGDAEAATLSIGGPAVNYVLNVTVRDGNGDGRVVVVFDTAAAGDEATTATVGDPEDSLTVRGPETELASLLAAGDYPMTLYSGAGTTTEADIGTLVVYEPANGETTTAGGEDGTGTRADVEVTGQQPSGPGLLDRLTGGLGAIVLGGVLAVVGIVTMLGLHRS